MIPFVIALVLGPRTIAPEKVVQVLGIRVGQDNAEMLEKRFGTAKRANTGRPDNSRYWDFPGGFRIYSDGFGTRDGKTPTDYLEVTGWSGRLDKLKVKGKPLEFGPFGPLTRGMSPAKIHKVMDPVLGKPTDTGETFFWRKLVTHGDATRMFRFRTTFKKGVLDKVSWETGSR